MKLNEILQKDPGIWALFTRSEEYQSFIADKYNRFPYCASKNRDIYEPKASEYLINNGFHVEYPEGKPFALCLTHDIDELYRTKRTKIATALLHPSKNRFSACKESLTQLHSKKCPLWNFSDIITLEQKYGAKSSFFFMAENPGDEDYNYRIDDCETMLGELSDGGWEVGLHGGHTAYNNPDEMSRKKRWLEKVLNKSIVGYRNHYLRFKVPETWEYLSEAGFTYDSTLGYHDCIGFRNGMCHPFRPFNLMNQTEIDILEIPLALMDATLSNHMNLDIPASWERIKQLIDTVEMNHGVLTVLWHNNSFFGDQRNLYEKILQYSAEKNAWMTSGKEIASFWSHNVRD